jgi:hypothetical protein
MRTRLAFLSAVLSLPLATSAASAAEYDTIIRNGRIVDGTGNAWFNADVAPDQRQRGLRRPENDWGEARSSHLRPRPSSCGK